MKKLHTFAFYALVSPAIALGSGAVFAEQDSSENVRQEKQNMTGQMLDQDKKSTQAGMQNQRYLGSAPANGMQASDLIGTDLKTSGDESVGEIGDLIIDQNGQVVAVVVSVGGFLGMGEKHVAISWDDVKMSNNPDDRDLRVDMTRDDLQSAPSFEKLDD